MVRTQVYLPENLLNKLKKEALKRKTTVSELIRQASEVLLRKENLVENTQYKTEPSPLLKISEAGEKYIPEDDGIHDLSSNIDKYLYDKK